mmetsp:Transcript_5717/g.10066  ORF Transcript_5717/g.10066 Transcript_5717/m.10066 type:complete len:366 (-) Transcript_5717:1598-2695(-)
MLESTVGIWKERVKIRGECRDVSHYEKLEFIDEGTYGRVYRAREISTGQIYALKQLKFDSYQNSLRSDGFPITSLREISILLQLSHRNIINVHEIVIKPDQPLKPYLVMDYISCELRTLIDDNRSFSHSEIKSLIHQLFTALHYLHSQYIIHRDVKTSNVLLSSEGILKLIDFGLARRVRNVHLNESHSRIESLIDENDQMHARSYTPNVVSLWYRAPELLFGAEIYDSAVDMWSAGCVFCEILLKRALFHGNTELELISSVVKIRGAPSIYNWNGFDQLPHANRLSFNTLVQDNLVNLIKNEVKFSTDAMCDLIDGLLTYDPQKRLTAQQALSHPYFTEWPPAQDESLIQTFPERPSIKRRRLD